MIISHRHKFIFVKTRKTAGTSIEIALSAFCGEEDVITPITEEDERLRESAEVRGPQRFAVPTRFYRLPDWLRLLRGQRKAFVNHAPASFIRENVPADVWSGYFKFCFERDPFDKAISRYYWSTREPRPPITEYLESAPVTALSNWETYTIEDRIAVDFVGRYERLEEDLASISERVGLAGKLALPRAKGGYRTNREHYSRVLDARARARIEVVCAREIAALGYRWQEAASTPAAVP